MTRHRAVVHRKNTARPTGHAASILKGVRLAYDNRKVIQAVAKRVGETLKRRIKGSKKNVQHARRGGLSQKLMISQHNDMSVTYTQNIVRPGKLGKSMGTFRYDESKQAVSGSVDGNQMVAVLPYIATREQLNGAPVLADRSVFSTWDVNPFQLNPFVSTISPSTVYPGPFNAVVANDKLAIKGCKHSLAILNMESIATEVKIIWCQAKRNTQYTPLTLWDLELQAQNMTQSLQFVDSTIGGNTARGGASLFSDIGRMPTELKGWRRYYRVVAQHTVIMQPGDQHTVSTHFNFSKVVLKSMLDEMITAEEFIGGLTIVPMVICKSSLVGISTGIAIPSPEVTYGPVKLGFMLQNAWTFNALPQNRLSTNRTYRGFLVNATSVAGQVEKSIDDTDEVDVVKKT